MSRRSVSLLSSLLFVLLLLTPAILADSEQQFQELARDLSGEKLHAVLHDYSGPKFKHGVFPDDQRALDVIHHERAADATRLVKLAKRQSNTTTTSNRNTASTSAARPTTAPSTTLTTRPSSTAPTSRSSAPSSERSTTAAPSTASRRTTSLTSQITRTVTGPDGVSTETGFTTVIGIATDEPSPPPAPEATPSSTGGSTPPGLQPNVGLRVSGRDSAIVAVIAALCFFML